LIFLSFQNIISKNHQANTEYLDFDPIYVALLQVVGLELDLFLENKRLAYVFYFLWYLLTAVSAVLGLL